MKNSIGVKWGNLRVGILLVFAIVMLFWASLSGGGVSIFQPKKNFVCYFRNVSGLLSGAPVWMSGVEVGNVTAVEFVNLDSLRQVKVVCSIKSSSWMMMTENSEVQLGTIGFLGDKYVEIIPGTKGLPLIAEGSVVATRDIGSAPAMFKAGEEALGKASSIASNVDTLLTRMNRGEGTLGKMAVDDELYVKLVKVLGELAVLTRDLQENQGTLINSIEKMSNSIVDLTDQVNENRGTLGLLVSDPDLYNNLTTTTAKLDSIMFKVNQAEGSLGMLVNDTALYSEVTTLLTRVSNLVADIEKNPRKYFKFSVF